MGFGFISILSPNTIQDPEDKDTGQGWLSDGMQEKEQEVLACVCPD